MKLDREMVKLAMAYQGDDGLRGFLKGQKELVRDVVSTTRGVLRTRTRGRSTAAFWR
mgnify:CR=1 FL=1